MPQNRKIHDTKTFITEADIKYNNKFDYSKFVYVNAKTRSTIICPIHGEFEQTPDKHMGGVYGCTRCSYDLKDKSYNRPPTPKRIEEATIIDRFYHKFDKNKYKIEILDYAGVDSKVSIFCELHMSLRKCLARNVIHSKIKTPCLQCSRIEQLQSKTHTYDSVIQQLTNMYHGVYIYPDDNHITYKNKRSRIKILCPIHGAFFKTAQKHLAGQGCERCGIDKLIRDGKLVGGYSKKYFVDNPDKINIPAFLYYIKVGSAFKIGITTDLSRRMISIKSASKRNVDIISVKVYTLYEAFEREQSILDANSNFRTFRKWSTEVFNFDISLFIGEHF